jgi:hypothetical protein
MEPIGRRRPRQGARPPPPTGLMGTFDVHASEITERRAIDGSGVNVVGRFGVTGATPKRRCQLRNEGLSPGCGRADTERRWPSAGVIALALSAAGGRRNRHFEDAVNGFHGVCYRARESEVAKASGRCARRDIICRIPAASAQRAFEDADLWRRRRHDGGAPYRQWQDATPVGRSRGRAAAIWH